MGWWTLGGDRSQPMTERVRGEFGGEVLRIEQASARTFHVLVKGAEEARAQWAVALVENGMVKTMGESAGPYCEPCSPEFYAAAVEACGAPDDTYGGTWAKAFRERMAPEPVAA